MADAPPESRPLARTPRGFADRRARDLRAERAILTAVSGVYESYGFEPLDTSAFEYADALGKFLPDSDRPNAGVFALRDGEDGDEGAGEWMALRYDLTAPLARFAAQNWETLPKPFRRYAYGTVWRNEKPGPGRYREFTQCDADTVGSARPEADAEIIAMAVEGLAAAGLPSGAAVVKINDRRLLDGVLSAAGVAEGAQKLVVMRAIDKLDRLGWEGVHDLLGEGRLDESGAYTRGAGLDPAARSLVGEFLALFLNVSFESRTAVLNALSNFDRHELEGPVTSLAALDSALKALGVGEAQARFDPSVVRGLEYYTGPVFEAELLLDTIDEQGKPVRFGSIGGGGRYDDLVARFTGSSIPATGFSFGVSRLAAALRAAGRDPGAASRGPVIVIAFSQDRMADYFTIARELRAGGVPAEVYLGTSGMKAQMKYADRRLAPAAVIVGDDELAAGTVTVKDLDLGRRLATEVSGNAAWRIERPGQATIPRAELLAFVRRIVEG